VGGKAQSPTRKRPFKLQIFRKEKKSRARDEKGSIVPKEAPKGKKRVRRHSSKRQQKTIQRGRVRRALRAGERQPREEKESYAGWGGSGRILISNSFRQEAHGKNEEFSAKEKGARVVL